MEKKIKRRFSTKSSDLPEIIAFVHGFMETCFVGSKHKKHIELAIEEMAVNVIHYAYQDKVGPIDIELTQDDPQHLTIEIIDWGEPFDPTVTHLKQDTSEEDIEDLKEGGLGIHLTNQVMDNVDYQRIGMENHLTMRKAI